MKSTIESTYLYSTFYSKILHQSLTEDIGRQHLKNQIVEVTTLMSVSDNKEQFKQLFDRMYGVQTRETI